MNGLPYVGAELRVDLSGYVNADSTLSLDLLRILPELLGDNDVPTVLEVGAATSIGPALAGRFAGLLADRQSPVRVTGTDSDGIVAIAQMLTRFITAVTK